ncbi:MAG: hypothetical protein AAFX06_06180 [Planctomycetota bacterium]
MEYSAINFETMAPADVVFQNNWIGTCRQFSLTIGGCLHRMRFQKFANGDPSLNQYVEVQFGSHYVLIYLDHWEQCLEQKDVLAGATLSELPTDVVSIVIESMLEETLDKISSVSGPCHVSRFLSDSELPEVETRIGFQLEGSDGDLIEGGLLFGPGFSSLCRKWLGEKDNLAVAKATAFPVRYPIIIGESTISRTQLKQLKRHDVIVVASEKGPRLELNDRLECYGEVSEGRFVVAELTEARPTDSLTGDCTIRFSAGHVSTDTRQLQTLSPGQTALPVHQERIGLWLGSQCFAEGERVVFDQRPAVRILNLASSP